MVNASEQEPFAMDVYGDGAIATGTADAPVALSTTTVVAAAVRAHDHGQPVEIRGAVRSPLGRPVVEAVVRAVPAATVRRARQPRPQGWLALDLAFSDRPDAADLRADLVERATEAGAVAQLLGLATKHCRPDAVRALRSIAGRAAPAVPQGAGPDAVTLQTATWPFVAYFGLFVVAFWALALLSWRDGVGMIISLALVPVAIGALTLLVALGSWQRTCFDGSRVWVGDLGGSWRGPIDIARIDAYRERHVYKRSEVSLYEPAFDGEVTSFRKHGFTAADAERLERRGSHRVLVLRVERGHLFHGLARHIRRYADSETCVIVGGPVWASPG